MWEGLGVGGVASWAQGVWNEGSLQVLFYFSQALKAHHPALNRLAC